MIGTPAPEGMPREEVAAWYWARVVEHEAAIQDLATGAIEAGVVGDVVKAAGFAEPVQLSSLLAPYRTMPGGLDERHTEARRNALGGQYTGAGWTPGW